MENSVARIRSELKEGMSLAKCKKCRCMKEALENLHSALPSLQTKATTDLLANVKNWLTQLEQTEYSCLGCEHCFPAVVTNVFNQAFPETTLPTTSCSFEVRDQVWPPVPGEYFALCDDSSCSVAVSTLGNVELAETLARKKPKGLCLVGKTETENIGIDKVIKNTITNPNICFFILAGKDTAGHQSGKTLLALWQNGVDENMSVVGSPAVHPVLKNVSLEEIEAFRKQVKIVDMMGCEDPAQIVKQIRGLSTVAKKTCSCKECSSPTKPVQITTAPIVHAEKTPKAEIDKAGYFVIIPQPPRKIVAEHYSYDNKLLQVIEGGDATAMYSTIVKKGWVTQLSHAAYVGKELAKAELSLKLGFKYVQDKTQYHPRKRQKKAKR